MTRATRRLSSNLLIEIIKQNKNDLDKLDIIVLEKKKNGKNLSRRISDILKKKASFFKRNNYARFRSISAIESNVWNGS